MPPTVSTSILLASLALVLTHATAASAGGWSRIFDDCGVQAIAVDPTNTAVIYVGTGGDGIYKTTDSGANWDPANTH